MPTDATAAAPDPDPVRLWRDTQERVCALAESLDPAALEATVPACPDWTARDLLAHMVGLGADVLGGDEPDDHNPDWTGRQVEQRRDRSAADLVAEWRDLAPGLVAWMGEHGSRPLNDAVIHEQDLRGAVDRPGAQDTDAFAVVRERMAERLRDRIDEEDLPPLALVGHTWTWVSSGTVEDAAVRLRASDFDLGRALTSRRTASQLAGYAAAGGAGPVDAHLDAFAGLGALPDRPLPE